MSFQTVLQMFQVSEINLATLPYAVYLLLVLDCYVGFSTGTGSAGQIVFDTHSLCHLGSSVENRCFSMVFSD